MKEFAKKFYTSKAWRKCRKAYISKRIMIDGGMCEVCGERLGYIVHHKTMLTPDNISDIEITLSFDNLQYVCRQCHDEFEGHGVNVKDKNAISFDNDGQPILPPVKSCVR